MNLMLAVLGTWSISLSLFAYLKRRAVLKALSRSELKRYLSSQERARKLLDQVGLFDIQVQSSPKTKEISFQSRHRAVIFPERFLYDNSMRVLAETAREAACAFQHSRGRVGFLVKESLGSIFRKAIAWVSWIGWISLLVPSLHPVAFGCFLIYIGWVVFFMGLLLSVEFQASEKAFACVKDSEMLDSEELYLVGRLLEAEALRDLATAFEALIAPFQRVRMWMLMRMKAIQSANRQRINEESPSIQGGE